MKTSSKTNWEYLKNLPDDEIDLSDAPELTPELFAKARLVVPNPNPVPVQLEVDPVLLAWFQTQGADWQQTMRDALREYALAYKPAKEDADKQPAASA